LQCYPKQSCGYKAKVSPTHQRGFFAALPIFKQAHYIA
jgi:hypothetical protein